MSSHLLSHVVRRGVDTMSYQQHGGSSSVSLFGEKPVDAPEPNYIFVFVAALVVISTFLVSLSLEYTVGNLMSTLAMVESPSATATISVPAYTDEPDAPLDKKLLDGDFDGEIDVEITEATPITSSIKRTVRHLHHIGGFRARWRGLGQALLYVAARDILSYLIGRYVFRSFNMLYFHFVAGMIATVLLCRLHMLWTHAMIAMPSSTPWYQRFVARKDSRVLLLPSFVFALTQQLAHTAPFLIMMVMSSIDATIRSGNGRVPANSLLVPLLSLLAGAVAYLAFSFFVAIPVAGTLAIVEACLLPQNEETIVPTGRDFILSSLNLSAKGAPGKLFASAWRSFTFATRLRVLKLYVKLFFITLFLMFFGMSLGLTILYVTNQIWLAAVFVM